MSRGFAEAIYNRYKGQDVEIFTGNQTGTQLYNDFEMQEQSTISGKLIDADGDMLIVETTIQMPGNQVVCEVAINGWAIESIVPQKYGIGLLTVYGGHRSKVRKR